ncbi:unnamed protein product [Rotaria magnacalcarata]|uniref:Peptidase S1 domain-containing protein n=1 Tax=Rotaria magnacalcarata TaxID=392030 RepID=A0A8S2MR38_9BILA|nr:unnamed protein product [Rotaria magnacalcarata]
MIHGVLYATSIFFFELSLKLVSSTTYTCLSSASCGCSRNSAVLTKIVGGEPASSQTWGWAASIRYSASGSHFCGGSIISNSHILTAAHCTQPLKSASSIRVYVGSISLSSTAQIRDVSKIYNHPSYSKLTYLNDIAILKLSTPLNIGQAGVDLVCLPNVSRAILASEEYPNAGINWNNYNLQLIAIGWDTCQGDSGGPLLMFTSSNIWEQVGITSVGYGCGRPNYPGIYTRVAAYQSWINATMNHAHREFMISCRMFILVILLIFL